MPELGAQRLARALYGDSSSRGLVAEYDCTDACEDLVHCEEDAEDSKPTESKPHSHKKQGTLMGVYLPVVSSMWGVLIFIRFSAIVGYTGWAMAFGFVFLSAGVQLLTTIALCAVISNSNNYQGGSFGVLKRNLGGEIAGVVGLMYYFGMTTLSSVELLGSVQALDYILSGSKSYNGTSLTGSTYWDQVAIGAPLLCVLAVIRAVDTRYVHGMTLFIFVVVVLGFLFGFLGVFMTLGTWRGTYGGTIIEPLVTGLNISTFMDNVLPDFTPAIENATIYEELGVSEEQVTENFVSNPASGLSIIFPMFLGIFQGANKAADLKRPNESIIKGTSLAILTSTIVYSLFFLLLAAVAERNLLKIEFLLFDNLTYPTNYIGLIATVLVGIGACVELLEIGPTILHAVSEDGLYSFLQRLGLHKKSKNGEPVNAVLCSFAINFALLFVASKYFETLATIVTMFFLQAYLCMHLSLLLNEIQQHASWRPVFQYYHWSIPLVSSITIVVLMFYIEWLMAIVTLAVIVVLLFMVKVIEEPRRLGLGTHTFNQGRALRFLLTDDMITHREHLRERMDLQAEVNDDRVWTPHVLCLVESPGDLAKEEQHLKLLHLTAQICNRGVLPQFAVVASLLDAKSCRGKEAEVRQKQQLRLFSLNMAANLRAFPQVVLSPAEYPTGAAYLMLMQSVGIGGLKPNVTLVSWEHSDLLDLVKNAFLTSMHVVVSKDNLDIKRKHLQNKMTSSVDKDGGIELLVVNDDLTNKPVFSIDGDTTIEDDIDDGDTSSDEESEYDMFKQADSVVFDKWRRRYKAKLVPNSGTIDVWWIVKDGGLPVLIARLLSTHRVWRRCKLRIFTTIEDEEVSDMVTVKTSMEVEKMLKVLRVKATVEVIQINPKTCTVIRDTILDEDQALVKDDKDDGVAMPGGAASQPQIILGDEDFIEEFEKNVSNPKHKRHKTVLDLFAEELKEDIQIEKQKTTVCRTKQALELYHSLLMEHSIDAELVVLNLPTPSSETSVDQYKSKLAMLSEGIERVLFVHSDQSSARHVHQY